MQAELMRSQEGGWSAEYSVVTVPAVGPNSSLSMLAIADMGQAEADGSNENGYGAQHPSLATMRGLASNSEGRRLLVHNGDISYARSAATLVVRRNHVWLKRVPRQGRSSILSSNCMYIA